MYVGVARLVLQIPGARSLKDRRQVVRSYKERLKARLGLSAAEVGDTEKLQVATFGVSVVSGESSVCHELLDRARTMAETLPEAILADYRMDVLSYGRGGSGVAPTWSRAARTRENVARPRRAQRLPIAGNDEDD